MQHREKQIEEMAKNVCHLDRTCDECMTSFECKAMTYAKRFYDAGYRKQSENVIELPCKVGTTLYFLYNSPYADKPDLTPRIYKTADWYFEIDKTGIVICTSDIHSFNKKYDYFLGETVFFTKEEAKKAIAELKKKYTESEDFIPAPPHTCQVEIPKYYESIINLVFPEREP